MKAQKLSLHSPKFMFINHFYSCVGAPTGQVAAQAPHSIHCSGLISNFVSPSLIQDTGQPAAQAPHLMQLSEILYAMISHLLQYLLYPYVE